MINLILMFMIFLIILFLMLMINFLISKKIIKNREKMSPFECGFDSMSNNRLPFSLHFYLIAIIFLIFDIEIALILPIIKLMNFKFIYLMINYLMILLILIFGLLVEWMEGAFYWNKFWL